MVFHWARINLKSPIEHEATLQKGQGEGGGKAPEKLKKEDFDTLLHQRGK